MNDFNITPAYYINLVMYIPAPILFSMSLYLIHKCKELPYRSYWAVVALSGIFTPILFAISQLVWILNEHDQLVGDFSTIMWILYDYVNGVHYTMGAIVSYMTIRIICQYIRIQNITCSSIKDKKNK